MTLNRRHFLSLLGATTGAVSLSWISSGLPFDWVEPAVAAEAATGPFTLPPLPYAYNALEPYIDAETMQFHHDKHHAAYVKNLNAAVAPYPVLKALSIEAILAQLDTLPESIRTTVRNNGGGHANHTMFWEIMSPNGGGNPTGPVGEAIQQSFGSFEAFQKAFNEAGTKRFGSGWAWLVLRPSGVLEVTSTANQDSPITEGAFPILGNDVWEHAYYLKYRNRRDEYLTSWWNLVNWEAVNQRYAQATGSL